MTIKAALAWTALGLMILALAAVLYIDVLQILSALPGAHP